MSKLGHVNLCDAGKITPDQPKSHSGDQMLYSGSLIDDLQQARQNANVKAVVLRVDCPGELTQSNELIQGVKSCRPHNHVWRKAMLVVPLPLAGLQPAA